GLALLVAWCGGAGRRRARGPPPPAAGGSLFCPVLSLVVVGPTARAGPAPTGETSPRPPAPPRSQSDRATTAPPPRPPAIRPCANSSGSSPAGKAKAVP